MENDPYETVNVWMRQSNLNPRQLIPALLRYDHKKLMEKATQVRNIQIYALFVLFTHCFIYIYRIKLFVTYHM